MITASDKIIRFDSLDELKDAIIKDILSKKVLDQRYCVRFIMLNDFETFRELTKFLAKELNVKMFDLQQLALGKDKTITVDMLGEAIEGITETSLVTPFSELVRFYREEDFNGFFNEIILTEDLKRPGKRIYIPIIGLNNRFNDFLKNFGRIEESAPIWQLYSPHDDKVRVFIPRFNLPALKDSPEYCRLDTMKDWLLFWRKQAPKEKILCSAKPIRAGWKNSRPDSIFSFTEITDISEFLNDFLGISVPFGYDDSESTYWEKLLAAVSESHHEAFSWTRYVETYFNTLKFSDKRILEIWIDDSRTAYDRWLLKNYLIHTNKLEAYPYFRLCLEKTEDYSNPAVLFTYLAEYIFSQTQAEAERYSTERYDLMHRYSKLFNQIVPLSNQEWIREQLVTLAQNDSVLTLAKRFCTGTFECEKELYFGWYLMRSNEDFGLSHLQELYPDLHAYLSANDNSYYRPGAKWLSDYFKAYREAKIKDKYTDEVKSFIDKYNADSSNFWDWYYKHSKCHDLYHDIIADEATRPDKVYWIDGLGAEFIPFIQYLVENAHSDYEITEIEVATTGLPSNTSLNRFTVDNRLLYKIGDLDELAHEGHYQPRKTLIKELSLIRNIVTKILKDNSVGKHTIAIVSDHGLSALSRLRDPHKLTGYAHHEGRYIEYTPDLVAADPMREYLTVKNQDNNQDYKVALTHLSLGKKPSHEVHGGCTPEEVLVPFIVLSNIDNSKPVKYEIKPVNTEIPLSSPVFECNINPKPKMVILVVGDKEIKMKATGTKWSAVIPDVKEGELTLSVRPDCGRLQSFDVKVYGMGMNDMDFDF